MAPSVGQLKKMAKSEQLEGAVRQRSVSEVVVATAAVRNEEAQRSEGHEKTNADLGPKQAPASLELFLVAASSD